MISCSRHPFPEDCPWEAGAEDHIQVDLADPDDVIRAVAEMKQRLKAQKGQLHALVNNAAISPKGEGGSRLSSLGTRLEDWKTVFQVNFLTSELRDFAARGSRRSKGGVASQTEVKLTRMVPRVLLTSAFVNEGFVILRVMANSSGSLDRLKIWCLGAKHGAE